MSRVFNPQNSSRLLSEERKEWLPPKKILEACGLKEGDQFFDVGCGNGFFTLPAAEMVGSEGEVHGFDISADMLEELSERRAESDYTNIYLHQVEAEGLPENRMPGLSGRADVLFFANILHEVEDPGEFFGSYLRLLEEESGRVVILDWRYDEMEPGPDLEERLKAGEIKAILKKNNLKIIFSKILNKRFYMFVGVSS